MYEQKNVIMYMVYTIRQFALEKRMQPYDAYKYLHKYKGIEFLNQNYGYEHTLSIEEILEDVTKVCQNNGGSIKWFYTMVLM